MAACAEGGVEYAVGRIAGDAVVADDEDLVVRLERQTRRPRRELGHGRVRNEPVTSAERCIEPAVGMEAGQH
jgi:hypothetical protein